MKGPVMVLAAEATNGAPCLMVCTAERFYTAPELDEIAEKLTAMLNAETPETPETPEPRGELDYGNPFETPAAAEPEDTGKQAERVEIKTTLDYYSYRLTVIVDGQIRETIPATPGTIIRVRNLLCDYWSHRANNVTANEIPRIPTLREAGDRR